jgi:hypothetical protein
VPISPEAEAWVKTVTARATSRPMSVARACSVLICVRSSAWPVFCWAAVSAAPSAVSRDPIASDAASSLA